METQISFLDAILLLKGVADNNSSSYTSKSLDSEVSSFSEDEKILLVYIQNHLLAPHDVTNMDYSKFFLNLDKNQEATFDSIWKKIIGDISRENYKHNLLQSDEMHKRVNCERNFVVFNEENPMALDASRNIGGFSIIGSIIVVSLGALMLLTPFAPLAPIVMIMSGIIVVVGSGQWVVTEGIPLAIIGVINLSKRISNRYTKTAMDILNKDCQNKIKANSYEMLIEKMIQYDGDIKAFKICQEIIFKTQGELNKDITLCDGFDLIDVKDRAYIVYKVQQQCKISLKTYTEHYIEGERCCGKNLKAVTLFIKEKINESISDEDKYYLRISKLTESPVMTNIYMDFKLGKSLDPDLLAKSLRPDLQESTILYVKGLIDFEQHNDQNVDTPQKKIREHAYKYTENFRSIRKLILRKLNKLKEDNVIAGSTFTVKEKELLAINDLRELTEFGYKNFLECIDQATLTYVSALLSYTSNLMKNPALIKNATQQLQKIKAILYPYIGHMRDFDSKKSKVLPLGCSEFSLAAELFRQKYSSDSSSPNVPEILNILDKIEKVESKLQEMSNPQLGKDKGNFFNI